MFDTGLFNLESHVLYIFDKSQSIYRKFEPHTWLCLSYDDGTMIECSLYSMFTMVLDGIEHHPNTPYVFSLSTWYFDLYSFPLNISWTLGTMIGRYFFTIEVYVSTYLSVLTILSNLCFTNPFTSTGDWIMVFSYRHNGYIE